MQSDRPARNAAGWWHHADGAARPAPRPEPSIRQAALAPVERRDRVFRALLADDALALLPRHAEALAARGLSAEAVRALGYRSLPSGRRGAACARVEAAGLNLSGVPGFYRSRSWRGEYLAFAGRPGLAIPARDRAGRYLSLLLRPDAQGAGRPKYVFASSARRECGTSPGAPCHWSALGDEDAGLVVTEGYVKADVAAALSGRRVVGLPGIHGGSARRLVEELDAVAWPKARPVTLAPDRDLATNKAVRAAWVAVGAGLVRAGYTVRVWTWAGPKGVDDALAAGVELTEVPWTAWSGEALPKVRFVGTEAPSERPATVPLAEAEARCRAFPRRILAERPKGLHGLAAGFGVGKTKAAVEALAEAVTTPGAWPTVTRRDGLARPVRVALLTDTSEEAGEHFCALRAAVEGAGLDVEGRLALLGGRSEANCPAFADAKRLGQARHAPAHELCRVPGGCAHAGACGYLRQKELADQARLVVAPKAAVLCNPEEVAGFGVIFCDEALPTELLVPELALRVEDVEAWVAGLDDEGYPEDAPERLLCRALALALHGGRHQGGRHAPQARAVPNLRRIAERALGVNLRDLVAELMAEQEVRAPSPTARRDFEAPWATDTTLGRELHDRVPARVFDDLVAALHVELSRDDDAADSRLGFALECPEGATEGDAVPAVLWWTAPNTELLAVLRRRCVAILDSTPNLWTLQALFGDALHVEAVPVQENLHVTQLSDSLAPKPKVLAALRARLAQETEGEVAVFGKKARIAAEREARADAEGVRSGWFGRHHRASNAFEGVGAVLVESYHVPAPDAVRRHVEAVRFATRPAEAPEPYARYEGTEAEGLRPGAADEYDADCAAWASAWWAAELRQALGRARGCRASAPVRVVIASRAPVEGLHVDRLCSAGEFLGWAERSEFRLALVEANLVRQDEAERRIADALRAHVEAHGALPSARQLSGAARCSLRGASAALHPLRALSPEALREQLGVLPADRERPISSPARPVTRVIGSGPPSTAWVPAAHAPAVAALLGPRVGGPVPVQTVGAASERRWAP